MLRRTPCIGICSTTYGDLVCRGCKRFAHEIVQWNGFDDDQRRAVWQRLLELRSGAVRAVVRIDDEAQLRQRATDLGHAAAEELDAENLLYELLQRLRWQEPEAAMDTLGVTLVEDTEPVPESVIVLIDREYYRRSVAQYERNYRIPAQ